MIRNGTRIIWFVEHVARELDLACLAKAEIERQRPGTRVEIRQFYRDLDRALSEGEPEITVLPFFYRTTDEGIRELVHRWKRTLFFTLSFEQLLSPASAKTRIPGDRFTREGVYHLAWGGFFKNFLIAGGVKPERVVMVGNPVCALYRAPYLNFYPTRTKIAERYRLDPKKKWLLFPEDQKYAFFSDLHIENLSKQGADADELTSLREYSKRSLTELFRWCSAAAVENIEVIIRPRPATPREFLQEFARLNVPNLHPDLHFIKEESARDWILAADGLLSAYSTTLIEAAVAGKEIIGAEIFNAPGPYAADWHQLVPKSKSIEEFTRRVRSLGTVPESAAPLRSWAEKTIFSNGDPIQNLLSSILGWIDTLPLEVRPNPEPRPGGFRNWINRFRGHRRLFSGKMHEMDNFTEEAVAGKVDRWKNLDRVSSDGNFFQESSPGNPRSS